MTDPHAGATARPDIRVDERGLPWQACPRCGQERIPSANGIRMHDLGCIPLRIAVVEQERDEARGLLDGLVAQFSGRGTQIDALAKARAFLARTQRDGGAG